MGPSVSDLLHWAGHDPLVQALAIILGTFILEDAATVLAAAQVAEGTVSWPLALLSLYVGIVLGDLGLYGLGRLAALFPRLRRLVPERRQAHGKRWLDAHVFRVVFVSRFLPGARLPTYTACGFLGASFRLFALAAVAATSIWTTALFLVSLRIGHVLMEHLGAWRWVGVAGFAVTVVGVGRIAARMNAEE